MSKAASRLRDALREHADHWDQTLLIRELSDTFLKSGDNIGEFATAFVIGYSGHTGEIVFTNAGHPQPLWYRASMQEWTLMEDCTPWSKLLDNLPLGVIRGTGYTQTAVELAPGDLVALYTDGISESAGPGGKQLGQLGLMDLARKLPTTSPSDAGVALLSCVEEYRDGSPAQDDETIIVLARTPMQPAPKPESAA